MILLNNQLKIFKYFHNCPNFIIVVSMVFSIKLIRIGMVQLVEILKSHCIKKEDIRKSKIGKITIVRVRLMKS
jgi:hypothetical protein